MLVKVSKVIEDSSRKFLIGFNSFLNWDVGNICTQWLSLVCFRSYVSCCLILSWCWSNRSRGRCRSRSWSRGRVLELKVFPFHALMPWFCAIITLSFFNVQNSHRFNSSLFFNIHSIRETAIVFFCDVAAALDSYMSCLCVKQSSFFLYIWCSNKWSIYRFCFCLDIRWTKPFSQSLSDHQFSDWVNSICVFLCSGRLVSAHCCNTSLNAKRTVFND